MDYDLLISDSLEPFSIDFEKEENNSPSGYEYLHAVTASSYHYLSKFFEKMNFKLLSPLGKAFISKGSWHFIKEEHFESFLHAVEKTDKIFKKVILDSPEPKTWHKFYLEKSLKSQNVNDLWKKMRGTCFGNSTLLACRIAAKKKVHSIQELKKFESSKEFVSSAQSLQILHIFSHSLYYENQDLVKFENLTFSSLGITFEEYEKYQAKEFPSRSIWENPNINQNSFQNITLNEIRNIFCIPFSKDLREKVIDKINQNHTSPRTGFEVIKSFNLLPQSEGKKTDTMDQFFIELTFHILRSSSNLFLFHLVNSKEKHGHQVLLQMDPRNKAFIFYDNNYGYYQWQDPLHCLEDLKNHFAKEGFDKGQILLHPIKNSIEPMMD